MLTSKIMRWAKIFNVLIIVINTLGQAVPLAVPVGLPVPISHYTREFYNAINNVPPGGIVFLDIDYSTGIHTLTQKQILLYLANKHIKWVGFSMSPTVVSIVSSIRTEIEAAHPDYKYGEDFVYMGYVPGEYDIVGSLVTSAFDSLAADYDGTPRAQLPLIKDLHNKYDFKLFIGCQDRFEVWARWWPSRPDCPSLVVIRSDSWPDFQTYYPKTFLSGLNVPTAGAEWEILSGIKGGFVAFTDGISIVIIYTVILIIIENILKFYRPSVEKKTESEEISK